MRRFPGKMDFIPLIRKGYLLLEFFIQCSWFNGTNMSTEKILHNGKNPLPKLISGLSVIAGASDFSWLL